MSAGEVMRTAREWGSCQETPRVVSRITTKIYSETASITEHEKFNQVDHSIFCII